MKPFYSIYKPLGATPYEMVKRLKHFIPALAIEKIGYAGRLDPMAEGILLLLVGEENKNKAAYENLEKRYQVQVVFGFSTDTYDCMGIIQECKDPSELLERQVRKAFLDMPTTYSQPYPPFSSKTIQGVPMYRLARNKLLSTGDVPKKEVTILTKSIISFRTIQVSELRTNIHNRISLVKGNFRQSDILDRWDHETNNISFTEVPVITIECTVSSGTYMRSLAHTLGIMLGLPALAYTITRTAIGPLTLETALRLPI